MIVKIQNGFSLSILIALASPVKAIFSSACYQRDGTAVTGNTTAPCININGVASMCCSTGYPQNDICLPNGLCQHGDEYWFDYCNDPTWSSPNCLPRDMCTDLRDTQMLLCQDGTWCCGSGNTECCDSGQGIKLAETLVAIGSASNAIASSQVATQAPSTSTTSTTISPAAFALTPAPCVGKGTTQSSNGLAIGLGVGLGLLVILGSTVAFLVGLRRGKMLVRSHDWMVQGTPQVMGTTRGSTAIVYEVQDKPIAELEDS